MEETDEGNIATLTWAAAGAPLRKVKRALEAIFGRKNHMLLRKEE
jgi:hypothetical protein